MRTSSNPEPISRSADASPPPASDPAVPGRLVENATAFMAPGALYVLIALAGGCEEIALRASFGGVPFLIGLSLLVYARTMGPRAQ